MRTQASALFEQKMNFEQAYKAITQCLGSIPSHVMLHIPQLNGLSCPPDEQCWANMLVSLAYVFVGTQKILWIDELTLHNQEGVASPEFKNIIIDAGEDEITALATHASGQMIKVNSKTGPVVPFFEDYMSYFTGVEQYFTKNQKLPETVKPKTPSIQEELTPSAIDRIKKAQKQKIKRCKKGQ